MALVCGVDVGSLKTLSYVAWLRDGEFFLDMYLPSLLALLPSPPPSWDQPAFIAFDAPQGLPFAGHPVREADRLAGTPTKKLPAGRAELGRSRLYRGLVEAGVEIFWQAQSRGQACVFGLGRQSAPVLMETYPRYVARRRWPRLAVPSKRHAPLDYVDAVWGRLQKEGYCCPGVLRPAVDQVDAMLCALAAESCLASALPPGIVGQPPFVDEEERVIREGYIVSP